MADFNKLAQMPTRSRLAVLVTDTLMNRYMAQNNHELTPLQMGHVARIGARDLDRLSATASSNAGSKGPWHDVEVRLTWKGGTSEDLTVYAWDVATDE